MMESFYRSAAGSAEVRGQPPAIEHSLKDVPLGRSGEPSEVAPCFVFLASDDASYITGQVLHPNGGEVVNG